MRVLAVLSLLLLPEAARVNEQSRAALQPANEGNWSAKEALWRMIGRDWCAKGIKNGDICCGGSCGRCGGRTCADSVGGAEQCCVGNIEQARRPCVDSRDTGCVVPQGQPPDANRLDDWCETGLLNDEVCCMKSCGQCGGSSCGSLPGGASGCCIGAIVRGGRTCSSISDEGCLVPPAPTRPAECSANDRCAGKNAHRCCPAANGKYDTCCGAWIPTTTTTTTTTTAKQWCRRGLRDHALCCAKECGVCGGAGCGKRNGGAAKCCQSAIRRNGDCKSEDHIACLIPWQTPR